MKTLPLDQNEGTKSQPKSSGKSVQSEEPVFEVADSNMPQDQEGNMGNNENEPRNKTASRIASTSTDKSLKDFDELMSTPIDFSGYILNGLKIKNLTQEILLGPAFRLLKGTRSNYAELEYDFEECYKALSKKLVWENPEGGDYPFDLSKPLPLITRGNRQRVPFKFFINNDLKYLQGGVLTMTYTTSTTKSKAAKYDLPGIEDMVPNIWSLVKVAYDRYALWGISHWRQQRKSFYAYARGMQSRGDVYSTKRILAVTHVKKRVEDLQLGVESYQKKINVTKPDNYKTRISEKRHLFSDGTLTRLLSSLEDITKNIDMEYLPKRRWSNLEKKRAHFMIKDINKLLKERRMMRSLEKFVGGRLYQTDLRLQHAELDESDTYVLERFDTSAGNPIKEILLKLNLPDHRLILTDSKMEVKFSNPISEQPVVQTTPVRTEDPSELLKVSMVKTSFQKLKNHLASFDKVMKVRTTPYVKTEGSWGFKHIKAVFKQEAIPFIKTLRDFIKDFNNGLYSELNEVKTVFNQMEVVVKQCSADKRYFDIQKKEIFLNND
ncbi:hypothetical protein Tco_0506739 [Tanacetum coccineum]